MTCKRCRESIVYLGDWPSCSCDKVPGLTLTVRDAASYMSVSRSLIYRLLAEGGIFANRAARPARIPLSSIKAYWAADHRAWRRHEDIYRLDRR